MFDFFFFFLIEGKKEGEKSSTAYQIELTVQKSWAKSLYSLLICFSWGWFLHVMMLQCSIMNYCKPIVCKYSCYFVSVKLYILLLLLLVRVLKLVCVYWIRNNLNIVMIIAEVSIWTDIIYSVFVATVHGICYWNIIYVYACIECWLIKWKATSLWILMVQNDWRCS